MAADRAAGEPPETPEASEQQRSMDALAALGHISRDLASTTDPSSVMRSVFDRLVMATGLEVLLSFVVTQEGRLQPDSCFGVPDEVGTALEHGDAEEGLSLAVAAERVALIADDLQRSEDPRAAFARSLGLQAYACFPLLARGELIGTLGFGTRRRARFEPRERDVYRTACDQLALALDRGGLVKALDEERGRRAEFERERAALLTRERAARSEAEDSGRARDELLSVLSHELRTPLNVMLGWVRMLRAGQFDEAQTARALEVVERNIRTQAELINELDASRIVSGQRGLDRQPLDLWQVVQSALEAVVPSAEAKGLLVRSVLGSQPLPMVGDAVRLQQAIAGILNNALKFTPAGGAITVRLESRGDRARLTVSDTGEGIPAELLPRIFDRGRALDNRTTRAHGGLGLGLSIVRRLVEMHGGFVRAESGGARKGATFTVELPIRTADAPMAAPEPTEAVEPAGQGLEGFRLLVVDDDADTRELMAVMLREEGATVAAVGSVAEAYRQVGIFAPDVVLCDISMPGEDGFRLLEWVKQDERRTARPLPVIALTARATLEDRHRILAAGFRDYIAKPLELPDLTRVIVRVAGRSRA